MIVGYSISTAADQWLWYVWHVTWQASLLAALIVLIARVGRRRSVRLAYGLLVLALVKFAIFPTFSLWTGLFSHLGPAVTVPSRPVGPPVLVWLMLTHVVGALVIAGWAVFQMVHVAHLVRSAAPVTSGPVYRHLSYMARKMGLHRSVRLLACRNGTSPMAFGVLTPSVIVPASMLNDLPSRKVATVLAHELAHHRRGDLWINWLQVVLTVLWWFNPLIWVLNRALRKMREDCCDDLLLREDLATDDGYCETLLLVAAQMSRSRLLRGIPRFAERLHPLGQRIIRIMDPDIHRRSPLSILRSPALLLLSVLLLPGLKVHSFLSPIPSRQAPLPALAVAEVPEPDGIVTSSAQSARGSFGRVAVAAPVVASDVGRRRAGRLAPLQLMNLLGDVTAARAPRSAQAPAGSVPAPAWPIRRRVVASSVPTIGWLGVATMQPTYSTSALGTPAPVSAVTVNHRAVDLIDVLADSREEPLVPKVGTEPGPSPIGRDDAITVTDVDALVQAVDLGGIDEPFMPAGPASLDGRMSEGVPIASVAVEPPGWSDDPVTYTEDDFRPSIPEPTALTLLALGAAMGVRRRRA